MSLFVTAVAVGHISPAIRRMQQKHKHSSGLAHFRFPDSPSSCELGCNSAGGSTCVSVCTRQNLRSPIPENFEPPQPVNNKTTSTLSFVCVDGLEGSSPMEHCGRGGGAGGGGGRLGGLRPGRARNRTSAVRVPVDQAHGCRQKAILGKSCSHSMCSGQIVSSAARNGARGVRRLPFSGPETLAGGG